LPVEIADDTSSPNTNRCLQITLDGGSAQLYSPPIPVVPQFSYQLRGKLRTQGLKHNIVSCTIAFYDGADHLLEIHESTPIHEAPQWQDFSIGPVTPKGNRVRTAIVSVHLRPTEQADLTGSCFVDALWLGRLPKLAVEIGGENGIFTDPQQVQVNCRVSGFKNSQPTITFELLDVYGNSLHKTEKTMQADPGASARGSNQGFAGSVAWQPPVTEHGFYSVRVSTPSHSGLLMEESINFVVLPPLRKGQPSEFGWSLADGDRPIPIRSLPGLLSEVGVHWVKFPVWFNNQEMKRAEEIAWLVERLSSFDIQLIGLLDQPPEEVQSYFGVTGRMPIATAFSEKAVWHPALDPVMMRLSLKIRWWQLGRDDDTSFASYPNLSVKLKEIRDDLANFGQRVNVGIPWRAIEANPVPALASWAFLSYIEDLPFTDEELKVYAAAEPNSQVHRWVMLQPLSRQDYRLETRARDLVRRMLAAKIAKVDAVFVPDPFNEDRGLMLPNGFPGPLLLAWRAAATLVGGGTYAGHVRLPNRSENHVFLHASEAVMVVWSDFPTTESIYLGDNVRQYDIWGREMPRQTSANKDEIRVGPMPSYITGVNAALAQWRRDFRFETERLASIFGREQSVAYRFTNPFPQGVSGRVRFRLPNDWKADSVERAFKLGPGDTLRDSFPVQLGADATSGMQPITVDFEITGDENHQFSLYETIQVGLGDVLIQLETRLDEAGNLVVDQHLTNNTDENVSFKFYLSAPGRRRERRQVFDLGRGRITNNYILPNGKELLGQTLWLRAEEIDGVRVLNDHVVAHE
jgi:hypothetical protein